MGWYAFRSTSTQAPLPLAAGSSTTDLAVKPTGAAPDSTYWFTWAMLSPNTSFSGYLRVQLVVGEGLHGRSP
jgi:hypothetical protein